MSNPFNPLKLNIVLPVSKRDHVGRVKPLTQGDVTGVALRFDSAPGAIIVNTVTSAFGLEGLAEFCDLTPGQHTLQVAVMSKSGIGAFTQPTPFLVGETIEAPTITLE